MVRELPAAFSFVRVSRQDKLLGVCQERQRGQALFLMGQRKRTLLAQIRTAESNGNTNWLRAKSLPALPQGASANHFLIDVFKHSPAFTWSLLSTRDIIATGTAARHEASVLDDNPESTGAAAGLDVYLFHLDYPQVARADIWIAGHRQHGMAPLARLHLQRGTLAAG